MTIREEVPSFIGKKDLYNQRHDYSNPNGCIVGSQAIQDQTPECQRGLANNECRSNLDSIF